METNDNLITYQGLNPNATYPAITHNLFNLKENETASEAYQRKPDEIFIYEYWNGSCLN